MWQKNEGKEGGMRGRGRANAGRMLSVGEILEGIFICWVFWGEFYNEF